MTHCPYCGTNVRDNESYCIKCGKELPEDMYERIENKKTFNKYWYIPIAILALILLSAGLYHMFLQHQTTEAKELYNKAEEHAAEGKYQEASEHLVAALEYKQSFSQADIALNFVETAMTIEENIEQAAQHLDEQEFQDALSLINEAENSLTNYNGDAVSPLVNKVTGKRNSVKLEQLKYKLDQDPGINEIKTLLWEADAIQNDEASDIAGTIRSQIVDYTFSQASEQLNEKQFSDALILVEDGLKYAPESEKLQSLKTTIDKEKTAFETAQQQRIEQAINSAEEERKLNENDAIELVSADVERNDQGNLVIKGEVKSVATIPINSILVEYNLSNNDETLLSNEVYVYPDTLFPDEAGEFEFTHFDIDQEAKDISINVDTIRWYTDQQQ
ncbi:zinc ribbon domain-containing protein [Lentibacillus sp. CBA3610]|uniref:zinc ribbon domain-containing protein n=1 Tax=Lentibacillus sp. CBA3610 TaxID=2518176 RepID=UPI00159582D0|nr:zinc ribbon domain-containing protein [Lentibacillus sp. CBA3610]QKY68889.1 zinc ribbon domain-containing protein [Lentibacillus sp. CBA3610]